MKFLIACNWKMNKGPKETASFFTEFFEKTLPDTVEALFFVPSLCSETAARELTGKTASWGAQNIYSEESGAFTGENSPHILKEMGASHTLVGHSERRTLFHETSQDTNEKMKKAQALNLIPILCVGETLEQRKEKQTLEVLKTQISEGLQDVGESDSFHIAYEPVWAIGTGEVATTEQVAEVHNFIRSYLKEHFPKVHEQTAILYGGSVKPANASELSQVDDVGGFLIGGASLKTETLWAVIEASK